MTATTLTHFCEAKSVPMVSSLLIIQLTPVFPNKCS